MKKQHLILILFFNMSVFGQSIVNEKLIPFHNKLGKWGYLDANSDKVIIPAKYDFANLFVNEIAVVGNDNPRSKRTDDKYFSGYIRENGQEILPINFSGIFEVNDVNERDTIFKNIREITFENNTTGVLKLPEVKWLVAPGKYKNFKFYKPNQILADHVDFYDGDIIHSAPKGCKIERIDFANQFFYIMKGKAGRDEGISTWDGKILVKPKYINVKYFEKTKTFLASTVLGLLTMQNIEKKFITNYLFDENGKQIVTFKSEKIPFVRQNEVVARYDCIEKKFLIDLKTGQLTDESKSGNNQPKTFFIYEKDGLYGIKDVSGKIIIQPIYRNLTQYVKTNLFIANKDGQNGIIDNKEIQIAPFQFQDLEYVGNGNFVGKKDEKNCTLDLEWEGEIDSERKFYFDERFLKLTLDSGTGIIDKEGNTVIPCEYKTICRLGYDDDTKIVVPRINNQKALFFSAEKNKKWGLFDKLGKVIIPFEYGYISKPRRDKKSWINGWINIEDLQRDKSGLINIKKGVFIPPIYDGIEIFDTFLISRKEVEKKDFYKLLYLDGKPVLDIVYDQMEFHDDYFIVSKDGKRGVINIEGKSLIPLQYKYIWAETPNLIRVWDNESYYFINIKTGKKYIFKE